MPAHPVTGLKVTDMGGGGTIKIQQQSIMACLLMNGAIQSSVFKWFTDRIDDSNKIIAIVMLTTGIDSWLDTRFMANELKEVLKSILHLISLLNHRIPDWSLDLKQTATLHVFRTRKQDERGAKDLPIRMAGIADHAWIPFDLGFWFEVTRDQDSRGQKGGKDGSTAPAASRQRKGCSAEVGDGFFLWSKKGAEFPLQETVMQTQAVSGAARLSVW